MKCVGSNPAGSNFFGDYSDSANNLTTLIITVYKTYNFHI